MDRWVDRWGKVRERERTRESERKRAREKERSIKGENVFHLEKV